MFSIIKNGNCWTMGINYVDTLNIDLIWTDMRIDLIHPKHVLRVYDKARNGIPTYTLNAWMSIVKGFIYFDSNKNRRSLKGHRNI